MRVLQGLLLAGGFGEVHRLVGSDGRPDGIAGTGTASALEEARTLLGCATTPEGVVDANVLASLQADAPPAMV